MRWIAGLTLKTLALTVLSACTVEVTRVPAPDPVAVPADAPASVAQFGSLGDAERGFAQVVARVEPTAEQVCREYRRNTNCDFKIVVDKRRGQPANAYQSLDDDGRPVITFTSALIGDARNTDELAFVMGHEAAHHIRNHLARQAESAAAGAIVFAGLATLTGGSAADVATAQELGQFVGARTYSKDFELEADELGTIITLRAGYDPLVGAQFFTRIPDPGNRFLGTHPPNAARYTTVVNTLQRAGG